MGFHQRLASAVGTTAEIGSFGSVAVERLGQRLTFFRGFVDSTISEVANLFRMAERPRGIRRTAAMSGVSGRRRVALRDSRRHLAPADGAGESAVADALKLAVPT